MPQNQILPYLAPRAGLNLDNPANLITDLEMSDCRNMSSEDGMLRKRPGLSTHGTNYATGSAIVGADQFGMYDGNKHLFMWNPTNGYRYNATSGLWELVTNGQMLEDCESGWTKGQGADAVAYDSTDFKVTSKSLKVTLNAERSDGDQLAYKDVSTLDISDCDNIAFWIKSSIALSASALEVVVSESNHASGEKTGTYVEVLATALAADTWVYVELAKTLTDFNAVISISLYANATIASGAIIHLDGIRAVDPYSGDDADFWDTAAMKDVDDTTQKFVATNGVDPVQKWQGSGMLRDLNPTFGTSFRAKYVTEFKNHLVFANTTENGNALPQRMRWTNTGETDELTAGNASYFDLKGDDHITGLMKFRGDYLIAAKERSIWLLTATGDSDIFDPAQVIQHTGVVAGRTMQNIGEEVIFLGWDDVCAFNGIEARSLTTKRVRNELMGSIDPANVHRCFGVHFGDVDEYWLFVPQTGSTYPDLVWVYNYSENSWMRHKLAFDMTAHTPYFLDSSRTIGSLIGSIGDQLWRIGDRGLVASAPSTFFGDNNGKVYIHDITNNSDVSTAIDAWFSTKDFMLTGLSGRQRLLRWDLWWRGNGMVIDYSTDRGLNWTRIDTLTANWALEAQSVFFRIDCQMVRFRFRNNTAGETFQFREGRLHWQPGGARL